MVSGVWCAVALGTAFVLLSAVATPPEGEHDEATQELALSIRSVTTRPGVGWSIVAATVEMQADHDLAE